MSAFGVRRSFKQLHIEKHALESFIAQKKETINADEMTVRQVADLRSEEALLEKVKADIESAKETIKPEDYY